MRKSAKLTKKLVEEIEKTGIVQMSCAKVGLATSTYYRWYSEDLDFKMKMDEAIEIGRKNMTDFAESKMIKNINDGQERAIEFYLRHNDDRYRNLYGKELASAIREIEDKNDQKMRSILWLSRYMYEVMPEESLRKIRDGVRAEPEEQLVGPPRKPETEEIAGRLLASGYIKWLIKEILKK